jgi:hypothetical protein
MYPRPFGFAQIDAAIIKETVFPLLVDPYRFTINGAMLISFNSTLPKDAAMYTKGSFLPDFRLFIS